jgi:hypothetical protein
MANKETSKFGVPEPSFVKTIGIGEKNVRQLRMVLDERLLATLNRFPFSEPGTLQLPILRITSVKDKVVIPNLPKAISPETIEKIMDNVIISRSNFTGEYRFGPKNYSRGGEIGKNYARTYKTLSFPVVLEDGREYIVVKGMDIRHRTDKKGKLIKETESIDYFAKLKDNGMDISLGEIAS